MTHLGPFPVTTAAARPEIRTGFVEWSAVFAGAVLAAALSFVFLTFGAAVGFSATSPWPNSGLSVTLLAGLAIFWTIVQQIGAFMAGAMWLAACVSAGKVAPSMSLGSGRGDRRGSANGRRWGCGADGTGKAAAVSVSKADPTEVLLDTMLRPASVAQAGPQTAPAGVATRAQPSGVPQPEAEKRITQAFNSARDAADKARRAAVLAGFVTAASLIVSFGAAWWAALKGRQHRDSSVPVRFEFTNRLRQARHRPEAR